MSNSTFCLRSLKSLTTLVAFFFLLGFSPAFGQLSGAYTDNSYFYVFDEDGDYQVFDFDKDQTFSGSYDIANGALYIYDNRGRLSSSFYVSQPRSNTLVLSNQSGAYRLKYVSSAEDFYTAALIGYGLKALFDN